VSANADTFLGLKSSEPALQPESQEL